jgi:membrane protease YdiL (CAAX protease family)
MSSPDSNQDRQQPRLYEAADRSGEDEEKSRWPVASTLSEIADVQDPSTAEDSDKLFYSGTAFEFALGAVALVFGKLLDLSALGAGFDLSPESIALGLLWTIPPCAFVYSIRFLELEELKEIEAITRDFTRRLFLGRPNLALALFCFGAGFGEELLFRGVLHQKLESLLGFFPAAAMVGLGFGASHNLTPAYFTISGLTSFIFSYMFASSGSNVVVPIVAHATYDYIALKLILKEIEELDMGK